MHEIYECMFVYTYIAISTLNSIAAKLFCVTNRTPNFRRSPPEVFCKKGVIENFPKFTGKHPCKLILIKNH